MKVRLWQYQECFLRAIGSARMILIEPEKAGFGEGLTPIVEAAAKSIINTLLKALS
jgi:hypothetical protein